MLYINSKSQFRVVICQVHDIHVISGYHIGQQSAKRYTSDRRKMIAGKTTEMKEG